MNNKINIILLFLLIILCFSFLFYYTNTLDYNLSKSKISMNNILDIRKENENQIIIFHKYLFPKDEYGLGISIFQKNNGVWSTKHDSAEKMNSEITINFAQLDNNETIIYGYINNISINKIKIIYNDTDELAEVIDTEWKKIWIHKLMKEDFKIEIFDKNNNYLFDIPLSQN